MVLSRSGLASAVDIDTACLERLKVEGPPRWADAARLAEDLDVTCHESEVKQIRDKDGKNSITNDEWVLRLSWDRANSRRLIDRETVGLGVQSRLTLNPKYRFQVAQVGGKGHDWQLVSGRKSEGPGEFDKFDSAEASSLLPLQCSFRILGVPIATILNDRNFQLAAVRYLPAGGESGRRVRVEAYCTGAGVELAEPGEFYWADLDPGNSWLIDRCGLTRPSPSQTILREVTYQPSWAGFPFPASLVWTLADTKGSYSITTTYRFQTPTKCLRADQEFYLANYKIPESVLETPATRPSTLRLVMYFAIWVGALGLILFVVNLWRRSKSKE